MLSNIDIKYFKLCVSDIGRENDSDISARCPICGDSKKNSRIKRLHLYNKGTVTNVNCFNSGCSCVNKTMYSFIKEFFPEHLNNYKREIFSQKISKFKDTSSETLGSLVELNKPKEPKKPKPVLTQDLTDFIEDINLHPEGIEYLKSRGMDYNKLKSFKKWYFGNQDLKIGEITYKVTNNIIIPLYYKNEMYGFYSRSIKDKLFCTYMNSANNGFKIWNWFNVDLNKKVYIFEGIFDAISSGKKNIIALLGAKLPDERLKEIKYPVFCLDNDVTGINNMIDYSKRGYECYVQPKNIVQKDLNELLISLGGSDGLGDLGGNYISSIIDNNTFKGLSAVTRLKQKL